MATAASLSGLLEGRYEVQDLLGSGAFSDVYRAWDQKLGRAVAIKRLRLEALPSGSGVDVAQQRFQQEANVAARLQHPNVVTIHDVCVNPEHLYMVLELVDGQTLCQLLSKRGPLSVAESVALLAPAAEALAYAHDQGIVHRDVKPANIMIDRSGTVKVADFGIAKLQTATSLTLTGALIGTPNYMSPEQVRGEDLDGRSDLFSLGCVLYECLSGQRAFDGSSVTAVLLRIVEAEPEPLDVAGVGAEDVQRLVEQILDKDPQRRPGDGRRLADGLRALVGGGHPAHQRTVDLAPDAAWAGESSVAPGTAAPSTAERQAEAVRLRSAEVEFDSVLAEVPDDVLAGGLTGLFDGTASTTASGSAASDARAHDEDSTEPFPRSGGVSVPSEPGSASGDRPSGPATGGPLTASLQADGTVVIPWQLAVIGLSLVAAVLVAVGFLLASRDGDGAAPTDSAPSDVLRVAATPRFDASRSSSISALDLPTGYPRYEEPELRRLEPPRESPAEPPRGVAESEPAAATAPTVAAASPAVEPEPPRWGPPAGTRFTLDLVAREGADFDVDPEDADIEVDGEWIGIADSWDGGPFGKIYRFHGPGSYVVKITHGGYEDAWVRVRLDPKAHKKVADVDFDMRELDG